MAKTKKPETPVMAAMPTECCMLCWFYLLPDQLCRRFPPHVIGTATGKKQDDGNQAMVWLSTFPKLMPTGYCGEFRARANV